MRLRIRGKIVGGEPRLPTRMAGKRLIFDGKGREHLILDSGFTGSIAISEEWANRLDLRYAGIQPFELAKRAILIPQGVEPVELVERLERLELWNTLNGAKRLNGWNVWNWI